MDWDRLLELAPLAMSAIKPGSPEAAAFSAGYQQSMQQIQAQANRDRQFSSDEQWRQAQMSNMEQDNALRMAQFQQSQEGMSLERLARASQALQPVIEGIGETATDPIAAESQLLQRATGLESSFGLKPGQLGPQIPVMGPMVSERKKKRARDLSAQFMRQYGEQAATAESSVTMNAGEFAGMTMKAIRELAEGIAPPPPMPPPPGSFEEFTTAPPDRRGQILADRKAYMQADDRPLASQAAPRDERLVQIEGADGKAVWVRESQAVGKPAAQAARAITGMERQTLAFYNRAKEADDLANQVEETIAGAGLGSQLQQQYAPNMLQTQSQQRYRQAQRAFTEARLRKESGAAIPVAEYENDARTYFAQPGDSPEVRAQKRAARMTVLEGLKFSSGRAYEEFYGEVPTRTQPGSTPSSGRRFEIISVR